MVHKTGIAKTRKRIGKVGAAILCTIATVGVVSLFALTPGIAHIVGPFIKKKKFSQKQILQKNVDSLLKNGLIKKFVNDKGEIQIELTTKGRWEAFIRTKSNDTSNKTKQKWDGIWRVIVFDVPQEKGKTRKELRRAMMLYGFKMIQQSVWVYPHACDDFVSLVKNHLGVSKDVLYMKVSYLENDKILQREFGL